MEMPDSKLCPEITRQTILDYVWNGLVPGDFVLAVLENNFIRAIGLADLTNLAAIHHIAAFVYNEIPGGCWGSREKVTEWLNRGGEK